MDEHPGVPGQHGRVGHHHVRHRRPRHPVHSLPRVMVLRAPLLSRSAGASGKMNFVQRQKSTSTAKFSLAAQTDSQGT